MRRLLLPALLATLVLAGCSGDDDPEPKIAPSDSSSAASTTAPPPSPTGPVEPTLPPEAAGDDAAAAEAFVRFYWEMVNYAQATGDVTGLRTLVSESCSACTSGADGILNTHDAGGTIEGGQVAVGECDAQQISSRVGKAFAVSASAEVAEQVIRRPRAAPQKFPGGPVQFQFVVRNQDKVWQVMRLDVIS